MLSTIERLRLAIMVSVGLLLLGIAGSFVYGRWRLRHVAQDLPARLGIQIQQSTQGFVLSKTEQGRPLFTLRAARAVQFKSGAHVSLHNVQIDLYNRQDGKADTIAGNDFEFDPHTQIVESKGEAHMMLHAPQADVRSGAVQKDGAGVVRVTTHGLVFNQKTGVATCSGEVDFQMAGSSGSAVGAEYDSKQGLLRLESQLIITTAMQNHPAVLHALRATFNRNLGQVQLWQPNYRSQTAHGAANGTAGEATVFLRANGSAERLDAAGGVYLTTSGGMAVRAPVMQVLLNENNQPQLASFTGGVQFSANQVMEKTSGSAQTAVVSFDGQGRAHRVTFDRVVQLHQQADAGTTALARTLDSDHLVLNLAPSKTGDAQLQSADAAGNALFVSQSATPGHAPQSTTVAGQTLQAKFAAGNQIERLNAEGQTRLETVAANGDLDSSSGDALEVQFTPGPAMTGKKAGAAARPSASRPAAQNSALTAQSVRTAVQTGHVVLKQKAKSKGSDSAGANTSTATAARATYVAASDTLTLTGEPVFRDAQIEMTARRMEVDRTTGGMVASGMVEATILQGTHGNGAGGLLGGDQPVHIIAAQATLMQATQTAVFSGKARLWQGGNTIEAPFIDVSQKTESLAAYGKGACAQCVVSNFLAPAAGAVGNPEAARQNKIIPRELATFRVLSESFKYSNAERKASFLHHVQIFSSSGQIAADHADIFLAPGKSPIPDSAHGAPVEAAEQKVSVRRSNGMQSSVERVVATGNVRLRQPGRSATGDRLVYTASDGHFVLTGNPKNPPRVVDLDRGTVTGQVLTFASPEQAIIVSGTFGHTAITNTRVKKR